MRVEDFAIDGKRDPPRSLGIGPVDRIDVHSIENRLRDDRLVVGRGNPQDMRRVHVDIDELVLEMRCRVGLEQRVERADRIVTRVAAGLVDFVQYDDGICVLALDQRLRDLAGPRVMPLRRCTRQNPARRQRAHRHELESGAKRLSELLREIRFAEPRLAEKQHRCKLHRLVAGDGERQIFSQVGCA